MAQKSRSHGMLQTMIPDEHEGSQDTCNAQQGEQELDQSHGGAHWRAVAHEIRHITVEEVGDSHQLGWTRRGNTKMCPQRASYYSQLMFATKERAAAALSRNNR